MIPYLHKILGDDRWRCALLCLGLFALLWPGLHDHVSLKWGMRYFWFLLIPAIIHVRRPGHRSLRYLAVVLPLTALSLWVPHPLFRFFLLAAALFLAIESFVGKLDRLAPLFVLLLAPITHYFFNNFGFGIKLGISAAVAGTLRLVDPHASAIGNAILFRGSEFHVDPDCLGLRMITTSLMVALALVALMERRKRVELPLVAVVVLLASTVLLVIGSNYLRVIALVITKAPAGGAWHEAIGLACWLTTVLLPLAWAVDHWTTAQTTREAAADLMHWPWWKRGIAVASFLPLLVIAHAHPSVPAEDERDLLAEQLVLPDLVRTVLPNHVVRFDGDGVLIYLKPGKPFFSDDHHPMSCWLGSGFEFTHEVVEPFRDGEICFGLLANGKQQRYTAWWYDNGTMRTTSQLAWRWRAAQGMGPFRLVNVTADSPQLLMRKIDLLFSSTGSPA